jgi:hypothetical protein
MPRRSAARHTSTGSPAGSAAATSNSCRVPPGSDVSRPRKLSSIRPASGGACGSRIRRRAPPASTREAAPAAPAGCRVSRQRSGRVRDGPAAHGSPSPAVRARHREMSSPRKALTARSSSGAAAACPSAISAASRPRGDPPVAAAPAPRGRSSRLGDFRHTAAVGQRTDDDRGPQRVQVRPARNPLEPIEHRRAKLMQAGERKLHLGLDSRGLRHATPRRPLDAYSSSAVLPTPGSPRITSARLSPARTTSSSRSSVVHASRRPSNPRCGISPGIGPNRTYTATAGVPTRAARAVPP